MKKMISIILCAAVLAGCLCGCSTEESRLAGIWMGELDLSDHMEQYLKGSIEETAAYLTVTEFPVKLILTLTQSGTYSIAVEEASVRTAMNDLKASLEYSITKTLEDKISQQQLDKTVEEVLAASGMTMRRLMRQLEQNMEEAGIVDQLLDSLSSKGTFRASGETLTLYKSGASTPASAAYRLENNSLTLTQYTPSDTADANTVLFAALPLVLKKIN